MTLGNRLALAGWFLFACALVLAVRSTALARVAGGLARLRRLQHVVGFSAGICLTLHAAYETISDVDAALMVSDVFQLAGWVALIVLLLLLGLSLLDLPYHLWMRLHHLFVPVSLIGWLHAQAFLQFQTIDRYMFHAGGAIAVSSLVALVVIGLRYRPWAIKSVKHIGAALYDIKLAPTTNRVRTFRAGSIVFARFHHPFTQVWHPFSVASCRFSPTVHLLVRSTGRDTSHLSELGPGDQVDLLGPFAEFHSEANEDQVWIAGGVGVAPFLGMTRCLDYTKSGHIRLIVFLREAEPELAFELNDFAQRHANFHWQYQVRSGVPDLTPILALRSCLADPVFFACGPPPFMKAVRKFLRRHGVSTRKIQTEEFSPW